MYSNCTSLTTIVIPEGKNYALPATSLTSCSNCYYKMFYNCNKLEQLPVLPTSSVPSYAYYQMFYRCSKIMLSTTQTGNYQTAYRIPPSGTGSFASQAGFQMFSSTGGTWKGTPAVNTTYYTSNTLV